MTRHSTKEMTDHFTPATPRFIELPQGFAMKSGGRLDGARIAYETWGQLSPARDNAILILSGFSASAHAAAHDSDPRKGWWEAMIGPDKPIDTNRFHVICINTLGGCFGSTGPASVNPATGQTYRLDFPELGVEDIADAAHHVLRALGIAQLACLIGTSMGGMTALSMLTRHPDCARYHINISSAARASAFAIALRSLQRQAICMDPNWQNGDYDSARSLRNGMTLARMLGTLTYRSATEFEQRFGRDKSLPAELPPAPFTPEFMVDSYMRHQADLFVDQYDPNCYLYLSRAIDRFDLAEAAGGDLDRAFAGIRLEKALVIGVESDLLFPIAQQETIADGLRHAGIASKMVRLDCVQGHDSFLAAPEQIGHPVARFLQAIPCHSPPRAAALSA